MCVRTGELLSLFCLFQGVILIYSLSHSSQFFLDLNSGLYSSEARESELVEDLGLIGK